MEQKNFQKLDKCQREVVERFGNYNLKNRIPGPEPGTRKSAKSVSIISEQVRATPMA